MDVNSCRQVVGYVRQIAVLTGLTIISGGFGCAMQPKAVRQNQFMQASRKPHILNHPRITLVGTQEQIRETLIDLMGSVSILNDPEIRLIVVSEAEAKARAAKVADSIKAN